MNRIFQKDVLTAGEEFPKMICIYYQKVHVLASWWNVNIKDNVNGEPD